jgi:hypothetical protein
MDDLFVKAGEWLANLYIGYGLFFLACGTTFCVHLAALVFLAWRRDPRRFQGFIRVLELVYGLVNPVVYLLFIPQTLLLQSLAWLRPPGWTVLLGFWAARFWGGVTSTRAPHLGRRGAQVALWIALATVGVFFLKDLVSSFENWVRPGLWSPSWWLGALILVNVWALYAIPVLAARRMLRLAASPESWANGRSFFLLSPRLALASGALLALTAVLFQLPSTAGTAESRVLAQRDAILDTAARYQLDPRLIASVLYVITREHSAPFARQLERVAMGALVSDTSDDMGFAGLLDLSIGIAQIRPSTALAALTIYQAAGIPGGPDESLLDSALAKLDAGGVYKDFRGVPSLGSGWRLPASAVAALRPTFVGLPSKRKMVEQLLDDRANIELCGMILALYAIQWETANPAWNLRDRPEFLATLYQLGFERSQPKADPRAIRFGETVRSIYASAWMQEAFPSGP